MTAGLELLGQYINRVLAKQTSPLFVEIDDELRLLGTRGDGHRYGFDDLRPGTPMDQKLAILATADPEDKTPQAWR
ncbi:MAG: hypothetical protein WBM81_02915, partial [Sedimenticolaceae bacterium]